MASRDECEIRVEYAIDRTSVEIPGRDRNEEVQHRSRVLWAQVDVATSPPRVIVKRYTPTGHSRT